MKAEAVCTCRLNGCDGWRPGHVCSCRVCAVHQGAVVLPPGVIYRGFRTLSGCLVTKQVRDASGGACSQVLNPRHDVRSHAPDGYDWGNASDGAAQLALALTLDVLAGDVERARVIYQEVKWRVVRQLPREGFELRGDVIAFAIFTAEGDMRETVAQVIRGERA